VQNKKEILEKKKHVSVSILSDSIDQNFSYFNLLTHHPLLIPSFCPPWC